jgi:hypothetical protein
MDKQPITKKKDRRQFPMLLTSKYISDCKAAIKEFPEDKKIELVEHLLECLDMIEEYYEDNEDKAIWKKYNEKEIAFLKKHGRRLQEYKRRQIHAYYDTHISFAEKEILTQEEFENMANAEEQSLSANEMAYFLRASRNAISIERDYLLGQQMPEDEKKITEEGETLSGVRQKGKVKRVDGDNLTCLNRESTALLIYYLQKCRFLLKDENLYDKEAGIAFEILTGYSQNTLRQTLSKFTKHIPKENLKEIDNFLTRLKILINNDLKLK